MVEGIVKNITDFGAFIDIGGADGLLHISEMSWGRVENPRKVFKVGETVTSFIKDINGSKIALSLKFDDANPWKDAKDTYAVGMEVTGRVARMTDFGAFIELEPGVDALLHVSQIAKEHIEKPSDVLKVGEIVTAKVVDFNEADKRISLSIKALLAQDADPDEETSAAAEIITEDTVETAKAPSDEAEEAAPAEAVSDEAEEVAVEDSEAGTDDAVTPAPEESVLDASDEVSPATENSEEE